MAKEKKAIKETSKEELKDFAKELYLTPGRNGKHKYSNQEIAERILQEYDKKLTRQTVSTWSRDIDEKGTSWADIYKASVATGITGADISKDKKADKSPEETFDERVVRETREEYKSAQQMLKYAQVVMQGSLAAQVGEYKRLLNNRKATDITTKEFKAVIDGFDVDRCSKIEAVMNERIKRIRETGSVDDDKVIKFEVEIVRPEE